MPSTEKSDDPYADNYRLMSRLRVFCCFLVVLGRGARPREAQRGPERPREAQRGPERPRSSEIPRGLVPSTEKSDDPYADNYSMSS